MLDYKRILALRFGKGLSGREIALSCGCSKTAVNDFLRRFKDCPQLSLPLGNEVTNHTIDELLYKRRGVDPNESENLYRPVDYKALQRVLSNKGETLKRQWRKYNAVGVVDGRKPYSYRQYCYKFSEYLGKENVTFRINREPGVNLELDFAGKTLFLRDKRRPEIKSKVTIFVATLSYSKYFYAEGVLSCDIRNWIRVNNNALKFFGGAPQVCTPDNTKVAVIENKDWIDPSLNKDFQEWAEHNATTVLPAMVGSPTWKPNVEGSVKVATQDILLDMEEMVFHDLEQFNKELLKRVKERNRKPFDKRSYSRWDLYVDEEMDLLLPLPPESYQYLERREVKVGQDFSIVFDRVHYTTPGKYLKQVVLVRASTTMVFIYSKSGKLIREHKRNYAPGSWVIHPDDIPKKYSEYDKWSVPFFQSWASSIGPNTRLVIDSQFADVEHPVQVFRKCIGILGFAKRKGSHTLEACCLAAMERGCPTYSYIKNTIADFVIDDAEDISVQHTEPRKGAYKVDDKRYSLEALLKKQEENYGKDNL